MKLFKNIYMELALKYAREAFENKEVPIGAVIIDNKTKEILGTGRNLTISLKDPTAHAEIIAIRSACEKISNHRLNNCTMYSTLEPCPMCCGAIMEARIDTIYFGARDEKCGGIETKAKVFSHGYHHTPKIYGGIYEEESQKLLKEFFLEKRQLPRG